MIKNSKLILLFFSTLVNNLFSCENYVAKGYNLLIGFNHHTESGKFINQNNSLNNKETLWGAEDNYGLNLGLGYGWKCNEWYLGLQGNGNFYFKNQKLASANAELIKFRNPWSIEAEFQGGYYFCDEVLGYFSLAFGATKFEVTGIASIGRLNATLENDKTLFCVVPGIGAKFGITENLFLGMSYKWYFFQGWKFCDPVPNDINTFRSRQNLFTLTLGYTIN